MYGALAAWKTSSLNKIIERLIDRDLLRVEMVSAYENLPTLILTEKGERFLDGHLDAPYGTRIIGVIKDFDRNKSDTLLAEPGTSTVTNQKRLRKIIDVHPRAYEPWCDDEDDKLRQMIESGQSVNEIAVYLQRQDGAIRSRIKKLGLV